MKIAILGYGRMGHMIEEISTQRGHHIVARIDKSDAASLEDETLREADVAIEFSTPESGYQLCRRALQAGLPVVTGSTGWKEQLEMLKSEILHTGRGGILAASNFSLGMNLTMILNEQLARLMAPYPEYIPRIQEIHHRHKLDAPSGTAITLAEEIIEEIPSLQHWHLGQTTHDDSLAIEAIREGEVPGIHSIIYHSDIDEITLKHEAYNRRGFALGATLAAEYLVEHPVGVWSMRDLILRG
jgi:dihydrodipicolinate reductase